jgi:hypothetical protein
MPYNIIFAAISVPTHPPKEFKGIKGVKSEGGIKVAERIDHIVFLGEVLLPNELVSLGLKKPCQAIHIKVHQMTRQI